MTAPSKHRRSIIVVLTVLLTALLADPSAAACHIAAFSPSEYEVAEGDGEVTLTVTLLGGQPGCEGTVDYETADGTANAPGDYTEMSGELRFASGDDRQETITIPIVDDETAEDDETFTVVLSGGTGDLQADDTATVTITDDDEAASSPTPTQTETTEPTADDTPISGTEDDDGSNVALIAIIAAVVAALAVGGALLARKRRTIAG